MNLELIEKKINRKIWELNNAKNNHEDKSARSYFDGRIDSYREIKAYLGELLKEDE